MQFKKPSVQEVYDLLGERNSLIVHFSGSPKGHGNARTNNEYPDDLIRVLSGNAMRGLSCSTVQPGDNFHYLSNERKAIGNVGVVLGLQTEQSLVAAFVGDCGTSEDENGTRDKHDRDISIDELRLSISERNRYNEWVVRDYIPIGVFMSPPPIMIDRREKLPGFDDLPEHMKRCEPELVLMGIEISSSEVVKEFAGKYRLFTFLGMEIQEWTDKGWMSADYSSIYRTD